MIRFTAIRLVEIAATVLLMSFLIYALIGLMPGDPIDLMRQADPRMSAADVARLKALYGIDQPLFARYVSWAGLALAGDLGYSRLFAVPVWSALAAPLGNSLLLMGSSFVLALALALALGTAAARRPNSRLDAAMQSIEAAVQKEPVNSVYLKDAGLICRRAGLVAKAERYFGEALQWDPANLEVQGALAEIRSGRAKKG